MVVVPTATYAAIMNAASEAEVDMYKANALKEITDVRAYRAEVTAMTDKLGDIETAVTALGGALGGDNDYIDAMLSDIRSAISSASEEIIDGTSTSLAAACASIEAKIAESEKTITTAMTEMLETMSKDIDGLESAISGGSADTDKLESALAELGTKLESVIADNRTAYEAALEETGSELKAAIAAIEADVEKLAGSVGSLADGEDVSALAGDIAEVSEVLATITSQLDGVAEGSAFAPVYVLCGISFALAAAAVVLLVLLLIKRK